MLEISGKRVRETLEELLDPATTALLVIDMQVGESALGDSVDGHDAGMMAGVVRRCAEAIGSARAAHVPVIHVRVANLPNGESSPPAWLRALTNQSGGVPTALDRLSIEGEPSTDFRPECSPAPGEAVVTKRRPSAFFGTDLALILRAQRIETVAVVGTATSGCVEATMRDATHHDFYAVLIEEAVGDRDQRLHDAALVVMRARHDVCTLPEAIAAWHAC